MSDALLPTLDNVVVVLSRTTEPMNIGAACRAMKTMGLRHLRLISPLNPKGHTARALAHGAEDVLDQALVVDDLAAAVGDALVVTGTTARERQMRKRALLPPAELADRIVDHSAQAKVVIGDEEEREPGREVVHSEAGLDRPAHVLDCVRQRECQLLDRRRPRFADVVSRDGNGIPAGDLGSTEPEGFRDQVEAGNRRIDVRAAGHVFLEDVVLDGPAELRAVDAALLGHHDVHRQQRCGRGVDRHRSCHCVERDAVQQGVHVVDRVDRHAHAPHLARGAR